ncbi:MAG: hypothetical protein QW057_08245 [Candidatus Bathyarchaeia archaeon]
MERRLLPDEYRSLVERAVQRLKGRTEGFDDHYPCSREGCRLEDVQEWLKTSNLHQQPEYLKLIGYIREVIGLK